MGERYDATSEDGVDDLTLFTDLSVLVLFAALAIVLSFIVAKRLDSSSARKAASACVGKGTHERESRSVTEVPDCATYSLFNSRAAGV